LTTTKHDVVNERYKDDPLMVPQYVHEMYQRFREKEIVTFHALSSIRTRLFPLTKRSNDAPSSSSSSRQKQQQQQHHPSLRQPDITEPMRSILVDWIIEVHYKFKLVPETLHLAIQIVDRFMATTDEVVVRRVLQCVGVTSLFIACKYEEMFVPEIRDLTYICDGAYTESQVRRPIDVYIF
jgi:cyclin B